MPRIVCDINGYYDWLPVPEGTEITEADKKSLKVKQMADGKWNMRVPIKRGQIPPELRHFDASPFEITCCQQLAGQAKIDMMVSREEWLANNLKEAMKHHLHRSHIVSINVHDDGPNIPMFQACLTAQGITDPAQVALAMAQYNTGTNLEEYLNLYFSVKKKNVVSSGGAK